MEQAAAGVEKKLNIIIMRHVKHAQVLELQAVPVKMCATCGGIGQVATNQGFISIRRTCPTCKGTGKIEKPCKDCNSDGRKKSPTNVKVNIPQELMMEIVYARGRGDAGTMGGPAGDLYVDVRIKELVRNSKGTRMIFFMKYLFLLPLPH